jgi:hypothetical protein
MSRRAYCNAKLKVMTIQQVTTVPAASAKTRSVASSRLSTAVTIVTRWPGPRNLKRDHNDLEHKSDEQAHPNRYPEPEYI